MLTQKIMNSAGEEVADKQVTDVNVLNATELYFKNGEDSKVYVTCILQ